jgi:diguanylate cyclase (GGDEF)-like protein
MIDTAVTSPYESSGAMAPDVASLVLIYGGELGRRYPLSADMIVIGRDAGSQVPLDLGSVSRRHAKLTCKDRSWWIVDLGSTNGTYLNGKEVDAERQLESGDVLKLGGAVFKFIGGGSIEARYHEEIHRLAVLDGLTGVPNRRYLMDFLEREIARSRRHDRPLSVAIMDIDHFKRVNDTYGHMAGDHVLQSLATLVGKSIRKEELFARYGGEEFAFVLPETAGEQAAGFCERIRRLVEEHSFEFDSMVIPLTVSIGSAVLNSSSDTAKDLIAAADDQLYQAKRTGRNRVCVETSTL